MAHKILKVWVEQETLSALKNRAGSGGKSVSETAREIIESGLNSGGDSERKGGFFDLESIRKTIEEGVREAMKNERKPSSSGRRIDDLFNSLIEIIDRESQKGGGILSIRNAVITARAAAKKIHEEGETNA